MAVNDARKRAMARKVVGRAAAATCAARRSRVLGPDVQAEHRRHARGAVDPADHGAAGHGRARCAPTIRRAWSRPSSSSATSTFCEDAYDCAEGADALVIVTEWEQFRALDFERLKTVMERPVLVDLRNIYRPDEVSRATALPMRASGGRGMTAFRPSSPAKAADTSNPSRSMVKAFRHWIARRRGR